MTDQINEKDLQEFYNKGVLALEKKNYDYAIEIFSQILSSKYDHLEARHYLHLSLKNKAGKASSSPITNAVNVLNRLIGTLPSDAMLKKGNVAAALEGIEKVLVKNPFDSEALKKIGDIFYRQDLIAHAIQNLEEAKSINAKDIAILKKLGEIYLKNEDYKNAKSNYEAALKINPNDPEVLRSLKNLDALGTIQKEFGNQ
ncbi:MAG: tetratricopeptide repeat protein [Candidatus Omnitrophica bacterium]|nr:tetratricopeptide repeat protein [Candidatus Omnitrophota bacterium]MBU4589846.1 tetratricopeptide repeat protein [Candidatus Omnitrophota bacterium]